MYYRRRDGAVIRQVHYDDEAKSSDQWMGYDLPNNDPYNTAYDAAFSAAA